MSYPTLAAYPSILTTLRFQVEGGLIGSLMREEMKHERMLHQMLKQQEMQREYERYWAATNGLIGAMARDRFPTLSQGILRSTMPDQAILARSLIGTTILDYQELQGVIASGLIGSTQPFEGSMLAALDTFDEMVGSGEVSRAPLARWLRSLWHMSSSSQVQLAVHLAHIAWATAAMAQVLADANVSVDMERVHAAVELLLAVAGCLLHFARRDE